MDESTDTSEAPDGEGFRAWWESRPGTMAAAAILMVVAGALLFGQLSALGIWEPWEADEIMAAREYAQRDVDPSEADEDGSDADGSDADGADQQDTSVQAPQDLYEPNWATPTVDGEPVARPLLKTWLVARSVEKPDVEERFEVGQLERSARLPIAAGVFVLVLSLFVWIRSHFDTWSALLAGCAFASAPAIFFGTHALSTEMLLVVFSSGAVMAFFELATGTDDRRRWLWGLLLGVMLSLCFLEHRFFGVLVPLAVIVGYAVTQLPFEQVMRARHNPSGVASMVGRLEIGAALLAVAGAGGVLVWGLMRSSEGVAEGDFFMPHVVQWITVWVPVFVLMAGVLLARRTHAVRCLISGPGLVAVAVSAATVAVVTVAYGEANPVRLVDGEIVDKMPLFTFLLEHHGGGTDEHMHFAMWVRQLGFSLFPWVALVPLAVGYLSRATQLSDDDGNPCMDLMSTDASLRRLLLVWAFVGAIVVAVASAFGHHYYAAYVPLLAGVGLMLGDADFWQTIRLRSLVMYAMGFVAVTTIMMLGKDLERFPARFMEAYLGMTEDLPIPDDFSYGQTLKALKYGWMLLLMTYFFGVISSAVLIGRDAIALPGRFKAWLERRRRGGQPSEEEGDDQQAEDAHQSPLHKQAARKEELRAEDSILGKVTRLVETPSTFAALVVAAGIATAGVFLFSFAPTLSDHLSQRGIFQTYTEFAADGEPLYRYSVTVDDSSVYLGDVPQINKNEAFTERFDGPQRYFVVIPRSRLASLNAEIRKRHGRDLPILDARSNRLLLASNKLEDGEEQKSFISKALVQDVDSFEPEIPLEYADNGRIVHAEFDGRIELLGWNIDRLTDDGTFPTYSWGERAKMTMYFRVKKRISGQQKIFMHVDYPGSRIHGDHDPVGGDFPTNHWIPGDVIKNEYELEIDSYSSPGVYTIWMGFFRGSNRMKVTPSQANGGQNRVMLGKIIVEGML